LLGSIVGIGCQLIGDVLFGDLHNGDNTEPLGYFNKKAKNLSSVKLRAGGGGAEPVTEKRRTKSAAQTANAKLSDRP
jgi:hypothetical protein